MLHFVLWKWVQPGFRESYTARYVDIVVNMLKTYCTLPHRVVCVTDDFTGLENVETFPLWTDHAEIPNATGRHLPTCYRRLKLFDRPTQIDLGFLEGERIVSLDLDSIITGQLDDLFNRLDAGDSIFAGWGVRGTYHEMVFNGSFWTFQAGTHLQHVWSDFDPLVSPRETLVKGFLGSDQSWLSKHFAKRKDIHAFHYPEFASYPREIRRLGRVDSRTKIVFFHGSRKPWHPVERHQQPWITKAWPPENPK